MVIVLALLCALSYGSGDFFGGLATKRVHPLVVGWVAHGLVLVPISTAALLLGSGDPAALDVVWGAAGGLCGAFGLLMLYFSLSRGPMSVVAPITAVVAATVPIIFGAVRGERPSTLQWVGIVGALLAILVMSSSGDAIGESPTVIQPLTLAASLGAGLGFGVFFIALDQTTDGSGLWPLVFGRFSSFVTFSALIFCVPAIRERVSVASLKPSFGVIAVSALFDLVANVFYLLAVRRGLLSVVSVISSLYPASTVVLASTILHEKLSRIQVLGLATASLSVVLVAAS